MPKTEETMAAIRPKAVTCEMPCTVALVDRVKNEWYKSLRKRFVRQTQRWQDVKQIDYLPESMRVFYKCYGGTIPAFSSAIPYLTA